MATQDGSFRSRALPEARHAYERAMAEIREDFERDLSQPLAGTFAVEARAAAVDALVAELWRDAVAEDPGLQKGVALLAVGGYGRRELFLYSDVDLMFLTNGKQPEPAFKDAVRRINQALWDAGLRVSPMTRSLAECERFDAENVEFTLALFDARSLAGDAALTERLLTKSLPKLVARDRRKIVARLLEVTRGRHAKYGDTLFHLEPNVKECPGGLRDAHVCAWLARLGEGVVSPAPAEFAEARAFVVLVRSFLHLRHGRDANILDWESQDQAAAAPLGITRKGLDAAYWMRFYFRHARSIARRAAQAIEEATPAKTSPLGIVKSKLSSDPEHVGFEMRHGRVVFRELKNEMETEADAAEDSEVALAIFAAVARTGVQLAQETEVRLESALPVLSAHVEDGPGLWRRLKAILLGRFAGLALRGMHALGLLELLIPEFHGIDALVIRDAYHRYTVDEHTFVVVDTLHALAHHRAAVPARPLDAWAVRFGGLLRDLPHPGLLYLAALLHDTGKGHAATGHAAESARMAAGVLARLELDAYESGLVLDLIRNHLEMSAALRRDVFDQETIRAFAARVQTPEALRMLALFTYADIAAVHPDALTPWKAENLWRLYVATAAFLDRNVDEERLATTGDSGLAETIHRIHALLPGRQAEVGRFLEGFPRRYLQTRTPETMRDHVLMAARAGLREDATDQIAFHYAPGLSELTLVTRDRPGLFATVAGALAAWGMNIVTADAFSNAHGLVVDSFRFTDTFRTLELNASERDRFTQSMSAALQGEAGLETMLASRGRGRRAAPKVKVVTRVEFDDAASTHSTLLEVIAQDTPGLLRALSLQMAEFRCNIEVALVDTEGEMAIDVFYLTQAGSKLSRETESALRQALLEAMEKNAH